MFCPNCGIEAQLTATFCSACGTQINGLPTNQSGSISSVDTTHVQPHDISFGTLAVNFVGMLLLSLLTYPIPEELKSLSAPIYLIIRIAVPAFLAAVVVGVFYAFRKKKEGPLLRRSFVIASWVFLGFLIIGENGLIGLRHDSQRDTSSGRAQATAPTAAAQAEQSSELSDEEIFGPAGSPPLEGKQAAAKPTYDSEGWTQESTGSTEAGPWLNYDPPGTRYYRDANRIIYRLYPPGVKSDAEKANRFGLGGSSENVPQ